MKRRRVVPVRQVALLIETSNRYGRDLLYGVHDWIQQHGRWAIRLVEHTRGTSLPRWFRDWRGDGVIARVDSARVARDLKAMRLPVIDVSDERNRSEFRRVRIDNRGVAEAAFAHLQEKGLASLAYCGDPRFIWSRERGEYFLQHARSRELRCASFGLRPERGRNVGSDAEIKALSRWLAGLPKPVGVFASYDGRAQQVIEACLGQGLAVPDEVAVVGVDNDEVLCDLCTPPLSSVQPNARRTGFVAAELLNALMRRKTSSVRTTLVGPIGVVERQSTDAVAVPDGRIARALRYMKQHACDGITVKDVLREMPMSRTLFEIRFRKFLGETPHEHLRKARLARARHLLATTELSIAVVAELSGFSSVAYFCTAFRREAGGTPYAFRHRPPASSP